MPSPPLYNVDRSHVDNFLVAPLNIVWWGGFQATCTLLSEKHCLKLALYIRKQKVQKGLNVPKHFFKDYGFIPVNNASYSKY